MGVYAVCKITGFKAGNAAGKFPFTIKWGFYYMSATQN